MRLHCPMVARASVKRLAVLWPVACAGPEGALRGPAIACRERQSGPAVPNSTQGKDCYVYGALLQLRTLDKAKNQLTGCEHSRFDGVYVEATI